MNEEHRFDTKEVLDTIDAIIHAINVEPLSWKHLNSGGNIEDLQRAAFTGALAELSTRPRTAEGDALASEILLEIFFSRDHEALTALAGVFSSDSDRTGHPVKLVWDTYQEITLRTRKEPTFHDLKMAMLGSGKPCPPELDNKGWTRLWKDSGMSLCLKKSKPHRGRTKHGESVSKKRPSK